MSLLNVLTTFFGAALLPFLLRLFFDKFVYRLKVMGGLIAIALIIGNVWLINHGHGLIVQSGPIWIDMAFAAGTGVLVASLLSNGSFNKALPNLFIAFLAGLLAGALISLIM